jgi:hypothetical protein
MKQPPAQAKFHKTREGEKRGLGVSCGFRAKQKRKAKNIEYLRNWSQKLLFFG